MEFARLMAFAMEAGIPKEHYTNELFKFAISLIEDEREECAKVCEEQHEYYGHDHVFAKAIRARGQE
jgi:hypothetical protein